MVMIMVFLTVFHFTFLFPVGLYFDIKYRKVPISLFKVAFALTFVLNIIEALISFNNFSLFIFRKIFFFY